MSLEHAQQILKNESRVLAGKMHTPEMRSTMLVANLIVDLIEEVRWLRNDVCERNEQNQQDKP